MLIADRFFVADRRVVDLASGDSVRLDYVRLPPDGAMAAWTDRCATLVERDRLIDYGVLDAGRAFEVRRQGRSPRSQPAPVLDAAVHQVTDLLDSAALGHPRIIRLQPMEPPVRASTLRVILRHARQRGFVPLSLDLLLAASEGIPARVRREVGTILRTRHVLIVDAPGPQREMAAPAAGRALKPRCRVATARLVISLGAITARPNMLLVGPLVGGAQPGIACCGLEGSECRNCEAGRMPPPLGAALPR